MIIFLLCITTPLNPTSTSFFLFFNDIRDRAVCTNLIPALASSTYTNKCNQATRYFFELLNPRVKHHLQSPPGFDQLPYSFAAGDYRIPLDVLNDAKAGDFFALRAIGREYQLSFSKRSLGWQAKSLVLILARMERGSVECYTRHFFDVNSIPHRPQDNRVITQPSLLSFQEHQ